MPPNLASSLAVPTQTAESTLADVPRAGGPPLPAPAERELETLVIEPRKGYRGIDWQEMWRYRELLYFLVWRDVKVKYKMAVLGFAWALAVPVLQTLVYGVFGRFAGLSDEVQAPYFLYMLAGLLPWIYLQRSISDGGLSLVNQQALMSKIYLPRLFIPATSAGGGLVDMAISFAVFLALAGWYVARGEFVPSWQALAVIPLLVLTVIAAVGTAFLLSALTVLYRDLRFLIPFITQFGLWLSGVPFPPSIFGRWQSLMALNPYAGIVSGWRSALVGEPWRPQLLVGSLILCPLLLLVGVWYFRRVERRFADIA